MITFGSLFAGIGGFDLGFARANMVCEWQVETDKYCQSVLKKQFPEVERYEDVREIKGNELKSVDLISGGFPCQDVSVAGRRKGLAGKRSGLWFEFHRILEEAHPRWTIIENVPGLLSSNGGRDFAIVLRGLANLGYGVAYRILDAQYFGVAQRRRRLFLVGSLGNYSSVEVLFESDSLQRNSKARKEKRKVAPAIPASGAGTSRTGNERTEAEMIVITPPILGSGQPSSRRDDEDSLIVSNTLTSGKRYNPENENFIAAPLRSRNSPNSNMPGRGGEDDENIVLALHENQRAEVRMSEQAPELTTGGGKPGQGYPAVLSQGIRRLTPTECERLQGFPDGWTEYSLKSGQSIIITSWPVLNALLTNVTDLSLIENVESVLCTTSVYKDTEVSIFPLDQTKPLSPAKPTDVLGWLENLAHEASAQDIINLGNAMEIPSNLKETSVIVARTHIKQNDTIEKLLKLNMVGPYEKEKLSIILTWIRAITTHQTSISVRADPITLGFIIHWNALLPAFSQRELFVLRTANINQISDTQRYKMIGNAVCVPAAEWIGKRIMEFN